MLLAACKVAGVHHMAFPRSEHKAVKARLDRQGIVYTTRTDKEVGRYPVDSLHRSPWGHKLKVESVTRLTGVDRHPFKQWLTPKQKKDIGKAVYEVVKLKKMAAAKAIGLPDPKDYGNPEDLPIGKLMLYFIQKHEARRSGTHNDIRFGADKLMSFATKKEMPGPGERIATFQQPLHNMDYGPWSGIISKGYGAGKVTSKTKGEIVVLEASPRHIKFVTAHTARPSVYNMVRVTPKDGKAFWLTTNDTPTEGIEAEKVHYTKVPAEQIDKLMDPKYVMTGKVDGALVFAKLMKDHVEVLSHRKTRAGLPITHTYRVGVAGRTDIPKELQGTVLKGELYGMRKNKAIRASELGGILNSALNKSLRKQEDTGTKLKIMLHGVEEHGGEKWPVDSPVYKSRGIIQQALKVLPPDVFHEPEYAFTEPKKRRMWKMITEGRNPLTHEGVVATPVEGGIPSKVKPVESHDVYIREFFPGEGRLADRAVGGFKYSLTPDGPVVGEVGSGLDDEVRKDMFHTPQKYVGRVAKLEAQEQFISGALRAPVYKNLHEDPDLKQKASNPVLQALLKAKGLSDRGDYGGKHEIMRQLISSAPGNFGIDSASAGVYGITHAPTGFRMHLPKQVVPPEALNQMETL